MRGRDGVVIMSQDLGFRLPEPDAPWDLSAMTLDESFHDSMLQFSVL